MGNLEKMWLDIPKEFSEKEELAVAFQEHFGKPWSEVMIGAEKSLSYHAANNAYFAVSNLKPVENVTLSDLLESKGNKKPVNIIAS
ncbi:MAG: hypothetical protein AB1374_11270 [Bacillota bacterium]